MISYEGECLECHEMNSDNEKQAFVVLNEQGKCLTID